MPLWTISSLVVGLGWYNAPMGVSKTVSDKDGGDWTNDDDYDDNAQVLNYFSLLIL